MRKNEFEKTREEIFQERAEILYLTGDKLSKALGRLTAIEEEIEAKLDILRESVENGLEKDCTELFKETNREIRKYNKAREYAELRYYYLIVTREAMGLRKHKWVDKMYKIPPKKEILKRLNEPV
ncbi:MAG: hypothetical protein JRC86_06255 [Deltaproteobacteria bacterium]|nr:hypothetical protein [Deltaproteobacteria bacterium]